MQQPFLKMQNVTTFYDTIRVLKNVDIEVYKGEIVSLIGANGAGKTTTLLTISGLVKPREGEVYFENEKISNLPPELIVKRGIGHVPEGRHIFPSLSVSENLDLGAFLRKDTKEIKRDLEYIFDLFPILAKRKKQDSGDR